MSSIQYKCGTCFSKIGAYGATCDCVSGGKISNEPITHGVCAVHKTVCENMKAYGKDCLGHHGGYPSEKLSKRYGENNGKFYPSMWDY